MRNLSVAGLEIEASVRNRNFIKDAYLDDSSWQLNGGAIPTAAMTILNGNVSLYTSGFPYSMTLPLLVAGGRPPYTWSILPRVPDSGKVSIPSGSVSGNTLFGTYSAAATSQVLVGVTDSVGANVTKVLNVDVIYSATQPPTTAPTSTVATATIASSTQSASTIASSTQGDTISSITTSAITHIPGSTRYLEF